MIPKKVFEIGNMLGLNENDILSLKSNINKQSISSFSAVDNYKDGIMYGTVSIYNF